MAESQLRRVLDSGIVAVVRAPDSDQLVHVARALADGGVGVVEITMSVPNALDVLRQVRQELGDRLLLGAGTVLDAETARSVLLAGAEFIVAPTLNLDVIRLCRRYGKLVMPGAFTPTEILTAWEAGADIVKVFPADVVGPAFFKALRGPLPQIRLMPTGGVNLTTAADFLKAGACCLGIGGQLVEPKAIAERNFDRLRSLRQDNEPDPVVELIDLFLEYVPRHLHQLGAALEKQDAGGMRGAAHSLKGSARNMGANYVNEDVVVDGDLVTGRTGGHCHQFARQIIDLLLEKA